VWVCCVHRDAVEELALGDEGEDARDHLEEGHPERPQVRRVRCAVRLLRERIGAHDLTHSVWISLRQKPGYHLRTFALNRSTHGLQHADAAVTRKSIISFQACSDDSSMHDPIAVLHESHCRWPAVAAAAEWGWRRRA
jgi:hypothetical protein